MPGHDREENPGTRYHSIKVVSCAPSSATNTAISSAGSVLLALAETRCVAPGGSKNDCPTLNVSTGPPANCERISPLVIWEVTGSTVSSAEPAASLAAHSGSTAVEMASIVSGNALPSASAQARPPMTAISIGRASARAVEISNIVAIAATLHSDQTPCAEQRSPAAAGSN